MIEEVLITYLSGKLEEPVYAERQEEPDPEYYLIEKVGGSMSNRLFTSMIAIQSVSTSMLGAAEMNERLLQAMLGDDGGILTCPEVTGVDLNGNNNNTDPETHEYKYQALFEINHY